MDEYLTEAQRQINQETYLPPPTQMHPLPTIAPTAAAMPQIVIQNGPAAPLAVPSSFYYNWGLYLCLGFVFLLLTYVAVAYARDVRNRDARNKRHNLTAYVEYSMALANRMPHGHIKVVGPKTEEEPEEDSLYVSDVSSVTTDESAKEL